MWSTIEPQVLVEQAYPKLVEDFKQSKIKPKKPSKRRKNAAVENSSISEPSKKKTRKKKVKNKEIEDLETSLKELKIIPKKKIATIDNFLKKALLNNQKRSLEIFGQTSTPAKSKDDTSELDFSSFLENGNDSDLSDIIERIISRKPDYIENLKKNNLDISDSETNSNEMNSSSFFINNPVQNDLFEQTFDKRDDNEMDSTEEYDYDEDLRYIEASNEDKENCETEKTNETGDSKKENNTENNISKAENNYISDEEDSFCNNYIPLLERLKKFK